MFKLKKKQNIYGGHGGCFNAGILKKINTIRTFIFHTYQPKNRIGMYILKFVSIIINFKVRFTVS